MDKSLKRLLNLVVSVKSEANKVYQFPYHSRSVHINVEKWKNVIGNVQQLMIDMRCAVDKQLFVQHQSGLSLKAHEIISIRPQMQAEQLTNFKFKSSIHFTENRIIHLVGPNMNPDRPLCLDGDYATGCAQLAETYAALFDKFVELL